MRRGMRRGMRRTMRRGMKRGMKEGALRLAAASEPEHNTSTREWKMISYMVTYHGAMHE